MNFLFVGVGGFIGSILRYAISLISLDTKSGFPVKTFFINLAGSFLIGLIVALVGRYKNIDENLVLFLKVGICGGFTTFSSFALETVELIQRGYIKTALFYSVLSVVGGVFCVYLAEKLV